MNVKAKNLLDVFPLRAVENDCIISKWGDITVVFELILPEIFTLNAQIEMEGGQRVELGDFRELVESWTKAIAVLPENTIVHKQDWFTEETYAAKGGEVDTFLDLSSERHFHERPYLNHQCYLYLTKTHKERHDVPSLMTTLARGRIIPKEISDKLKLEEFFNSVSQFASILSSTRKITVRRLEDNEIAGTKEQPGLLERYMSLSLRDEIVTLADIEMGDELRIGNKFSKFYTLADVDDMPDIVYTNTRVDALSTENSNVSVGFATPVCLMLNCNHIYNQYIFLDSRQQVFPELEARSRKMKGLSTFSKNNEVNAVLIDRYLEYAAETGFCPVRAHFNVQVWTEDKAKLPVLRNSVSAAISKIGARPRENSLDAPALFWAGIPGNAADLPKEEKFWTFVPQAVCLLNQETGYSDSPSTFGVKLVDPLFGKPLLVDFSDLPMKRGWITNRNKFIIGPSGSGKSFLTNHLLRNYFIQGSHCVIVDVGDSYQGLCSMLKGKYLTYQPDNPIHFNPFFIQGRHKPDLEKLEGIKSLLLSLWKKSEESLSRLEETALSLAVTGYFDLLEKEQSLFPSFNTFFEWLQAGFKQRLDKEHIGNRHFDYDGFLITLRPFYEGGEYDYLLNSQENLDLTNEPFVVFELDNIKDNKILFPVVTIIIMDTFITKMRTLKGVRKIILIEEAWKAIMKQEMAEYIKYLYKTVRKHFGEAWIVTQEVDDIIGNKIVKDSIINNADTKILLDQRKYQNNFKTVMELLAMTEKERNICLSLNRDLDPDRKYKEVFVSWGGQVSKKYGVETSKEEYYAFSTEQTEKVRLMNKVAKNGGNYDNAIREMVTEDRGR